MRGFTCLSILFLSSLMLLSIVFAIPSAPPFEIPDMNANSDPVTTVEETVIPDEPPAVVDLDTSVPVIDAPVPEVAKQTPAVTTTDAIEQSDETTSVTISKNWFVSMTTLLIVNVFLLFVIVLSSAIHILKDKHPFLAFKYNQGELANYQNTPDAKQYTETFKKLETYIRQYYTLYSYEQIRAALLNEGFTSEEIESVYVEVTRNVR